MRLTDDRYAGERSQFELALRMIRHEARTRTIRECTGLSDDRIRKVFSTYFRNSGQTAVKRRRGKSPRQVQRYVKNPASQLQATTLVALFCAGLLVRIDENDQVHACWPRPDVEFGHRLCRAFETYLLLHDDAKLNRGTCFIASRTTTSSTSPPAMAVMHAMYRTPMRSTTKPAQPARLP
jgi:hypothetical protein